MPVIKSSSNGVDITVIIFDKTEIDALVTLMKHATFEATLESRYAAERIDELFFALGIPYPPEWQ